MSRFRSILLVALAAVLLTVMILTWGSIGSAVMCFCLIMLAASLLYQRFLTNRDAEDYQMED